MSLFLVYIVIYLTLGVICFVGHLATDRSPDRWELWQVLVIFILSLLFGGVALIYCGVGYIPWVAGYLCGCLVSQFNKGWRSANKPY